jgi:HEAT repeat protein
MRALPADLTLDEPTLTRLVRDEAPEVVAATVAHLRAADPSAATVLALAVESVDPEVQKEVIRAAIRLSDPRAEALLVERLGHASWDVRREAAIGLGHRTLRSLAARAALEQRLRGEEDDLVAAAIAEALEEPRG